MGEFRRYYSALKRALVMFRVDAVRSLCFDREFKGFYHGGHGGSRGNS
jgi:hypothetical protein